MGRPKRTLSRRQVNSLQKRVQDRIRSSNPAGASASLSQGDLQTLNTPVSNTEIDPKNSEQSIPPPDTVDTVEHDCVMESAGGDDGNDPTGRDLSCLSEFDWKWASQFAMRPHEISSVPGSEVAAMMRFDRPGITRELWDETIKPIVDAVVDEVGGEEGLKLKRHKAAFDRRIEKLFPGIRPSYVDACVRG